MLGKLSKLLRVRTAIALTLVAAVAAVIWCQAPRLGFDGQRPFAAAWARVGLIAGCAFVAMLWFGLRRLTHALRDIRIVRRRRDGEAPAAPADGCAREAAVASPSRRRRQRVAVNDLVAAALRWTRAGGPAWRLGRHSVYRLPWYLVIGEHGAGKSSMLRALSRRVEEGTLRAAGASEEALVCGWFGKQAVMLEASVGDAAQAGTWRMLIQRLRCARRGCPIDGIVIAVSARRILAEDDAWLGDHGQALRKCIDDASRLWKRRVPVYVVVTQCDRLTGFDSFVRASTDERLAGPLGVIFPVGRATPEEAWDTHLEQAFDALAREAQAQVVARMPVRSDARRAALTFQFPAALAALSAPLGGFVHDAFGALPERAEAPLLRSVHFSAVLRKARTLGEPALAPLSCAPAAKRACFVDGLFSDVIFRERGLARSRDALPYRRVVLARLAAVVCAVLIACAAAGLVTAYRRGSAAVAATAPMAAALVQAARTGVDLQSPRAMLALLDRAHALPCGQAWRDPDGSWLVGLGLVREMHLEAACRRAYRTVLRETVQPYVVARMAQSLREANGNPSIQFDTLRAYLMLGEKAHDEQAAVMAWIAADASRADLSPSERAAWLEHCAAWTDPASFEADVPLDTKLVLDVRGRLLAQPQAQRVLDAVMGPLRASMPEPLSVAEMAGRAAALALYRKSGARLSEGVPGSYTLAGLHRYLALRDAALVQARRDNWVLDRKAAEPGRQRQLADDVDRLYLNGYVQAWDALIDDVGLRPLPRTDDGAALVALLAGHESPLRAFLLRAAKETTTAGADAAPVPSHRAPEASGIVGLKIAQWFDTGGPIVAPHVALRPETAALVDRHFEALHRFVSATGEGGASPLDAVQAQLKEVAVYLHAADAARASDLPAPPGDALAALAQSAATMPEPLDDMLGALAQDGTATTHSAQRARINERWRAEADAFCHAAIDGRYPIVQTGTDDVTPDDFTRLFAAGGLLDTFFQTYLKPYVDTATVPWRLRPRIAPPGMSNAALRQFERAASIREAFFGDPNKALGVRFTLTPRSMDAGLTRFVLSAGGTTLDYAHDPARPTTFDWPDRAGERVARIDVAPASANGHHGVEASGAWSLFRLLDQGRLEQQAADRFVLTFGLDGRDVALDLTASSVVNPFVLPALHAFRCPARF
jgi:type VI secretion system protein ImpL